MTAEVRSYSYNFLDDDIAGGRGCSCNFLDQIWIENSQDMNPPRDDEFERKEELVLQLPSLELLPPINSIIYRNLILTFLP